MGRLTEENSLRLVRQAQFVVKCNLGAFLREPSRITRERLDASLASYDDVIDRILHPTTVPITTGRVVR
jgi:hypothetical protein